jgi:hypothetical protein
METVMPSIHLYPDPSDLSPTFYMGEFDLDGPAQGPLFAIGEAMLAVQRPSRPIAIYPHAYARAMRAGQEGRSYMFGLIAEQPSASLSDDSLPNIWATEQA